MGSDREKGARRAVAWAWAAAAAIFLLAPLPPAFVDLAGEAPAGLPLDKLVHAVLFGLVARSWLAAAGPGSARRALAVALAAIGYGALLELAQPLAGREAELLDVAADALGALFALAAALTPTGPSATVTGR